MKMNSIFVNKRPELDGMFQVTMTFEWDGRDHHGFMGLFRDRTAFENFVKKVRKAWPK